MSGKDLRTALKRGLAGFAARRPAEGLTTLIYHRVGGGSPDERDVPTERFARQVAELQRHRVVSIDQALDELAAGDRRQKVVLTFDDGFADVHGNAWPLLRAAGLPFVLYVATAFIGGQMHWEGSTAKAPGPALSWSQLAELADSELCTIGNHTHHHVRPERLTAAELDICSQVLQDRLGVPVRHFAWTWGIPVPAMEPELRGRFRSAVTGRLGRDLPGGDPLRLHRVPVRGSDPLEFFRAKLTGRLLPERAYGAVVATAKRAGLQA